MMVIMVVQIRLPIASITLVSACLASILGVVGPVSAARAADCLTAPGSSAPPDSHWYYRTDRAQQRKCWYLRAVKGPPQQDATQSASAATPGSLANFKDFIAQRGNANLSDQDVEQLYKEFLAWKRRPENQ
jgi:hypothetical protein